MPAGFLRGLVRVQSQADRGLDPLQQGVEFEVGGCIVGGISPEDDQGLDLSLCDRPCQGFQAFRDGTCRLAPELDGLAEVPQGRVHRMDQGMDERGLSSTRDDDGPAAVLLQVGGHMLDPGADALGAALPPADPSPGVPSWSQEPTPPRVDASRARRRGWSAGRPMRTARARSIV